MATGGPRGHCSGSGSGSINFAVRNDDGSYTLDSADVPAKDVTEIRDGVIKWRDQVFRLRPPYDPWSAPNAIIRSGTITISWNAFDQEEYW